MQDIGGGRLFVGGNGGDRRLRQQVNVPQALKCPRCESLNTKFCYYNNYNLSQPRHFCKSCRRYWTKGGVLRNVPVGGGCRKAKRTKKSNVVRKPTNGNNNNNNNPNERKLSNSQNSSSDSSSLTANTTTVNTTVSVDGSLTAITETGSGSGSTMVNIQETPTTSYFNHGFDPTQQLDIGNSLFTDIGHNWVSDDVLPFRLHHTNQDQPWMGTDDMKVTGSAGHGQLGFVGDQSNELKTSDVVLGTEDWNNGTDEALFDLTGTVDQSYWSHTHWDDHDHDNNNNGNIQLNYLP